MMDYESMLSGTRWQILDLLSEGRLSPLELSLKLKTTLANVSQQLRLLHMAGLVKTQKISQRDKGKPRLLYSIADDFGYLVLASPGAARKTMLSLSLHQKLTMAVWSVAPADLHAASSSFLSRLEDYAPKVEAVYFSKKFDELVIVTDAKELKKLDGQSVSARCVCRVIEPSAYKAKADTIHFLHKRTEVMQA